MPPARERYVCVCASVRKSERDRACVRRSFISREDGSVCLISLDLPASFIANVSIAYNFSAWLLPLPQHDYVENTP